jgi:hypothetical protein
MLVVAVLTIIAFVWLYNPANMEKIGANAAFSAYGRTLTRADLQREANKFFLARDLGQLELIQGLSGFGTDENQMVDTFVWNLLVLQHEAGVLGINPTDDQIVERIRGIRSFQTDGQFDPVKYGRFVSEKLGPRGFTELQLQGVIKDAISLELVRTVVSSPVAVTPGEVADAARMMQKVDIQSVAFTAESVNGTATVTDQEIEGVFAQNQNSPAFVAPETRTVEFVEFQLPEADKAAAGKERVEALQKLVDQASQFAAKASAESFAGAAQSAGLTVQKSAEFDRSGTTREAAPAGGPDLAAIAPFAFLLTEQASVSEPIQAGDRFYVAKLAGVTPQRPLTLTEVRPLIEAQLRSQKTAQLLRQGADAKLAQIREAMKSGKSFTDAATEAGLKVETASGLLPTGASPEQRVLVRATLMMQPGQLSGFLPSVQGGGGAVYLAARAPVEAAEFDKQKAEIEAGILEGKREMLFLSWLSAARDAAQIARVEHSR